jgi:hypothetical protein
MKSSKRLLLVCFLLSLGAWAQTGRSDAPQSRSAHPAPVQKMPKHAARNLTQREKQERAQLRAAQRRQAKLAKKQRKDAARRSRRLRKTRTASQ